MRVTENVFTACLLETIICNTPKLKFAEIFFSSCINLKDVIITMYNVIDTTDMFKDSVNIKNITIIGTLQCDFNISSCTKLIFDSIKSILTTASIYTVSDSHTLNFAISIADRSNKLAALVNTCATKHWTIT